jgi:hypothetical protein
MRGRECPEDMYRKEEERQIHTWTGKILSALDPPYVLRIVFEGTTPTTRVCKLVMVLRSNTSPRTLV